METRCENTELRLGLIFTGGEGPGPEKIKRLYKNLSEDSEYRTAEILTVAADSGLILAETAGIKPDWVIGDMDSLDTEKRLDRYNPDRVIRYNADKDYTDTELAFNFLRENGCGEIWILGGGGGRIDHLFGIRDMFEREFPPARWITGGENIICINGEGTAVTMGLRPGCLVSVFPLGGGPWGIKSLGLKWPLDNVQWKRGLYGLSNVAVEEEITVVAGQGRFMIVFSNMEG